MNNSGQIEYDAKYPKTADIETNKEAKIEIMRKNILRKVMIQTNDKQYYGKIIDVLDAETYLVSVGINHDCEVNEQLIHFVENIY